MNSYFPIPRYISRAMSDSFEDDAVFIGRWHTDHILDSSISISDLVMWDENTDTTESRKTQLITCECLMAYTGCLRSLNLVGFEMSWSIRRTAKLRYGEDWILEDEFRSTSVGIRNSKQLVRKTRLNASREWLVGKFLNVELRHLHSGESEIALVAQTLTKSFLLRPACCKHGHNQQ